MDVSIIIVNYKTPKLVLDCINSINKYVDGFTYEIIVVDNDSKDDSKEMILNSFPNIKYIESTVNLGFGKANNLGAKNAVGEYLFLLNSDTILYDNSVFELFDYIKKHLDVGIVGGNLHNMDMSPQASYCLKFDSLDELKKSAKWSSIIRERFTKSRFSKKRPVIEYYNNSNKPLEVAYVFGTDLMISKKLFNSIGGFDPDFFMYSEEQDLCFRVSKQKLKIVSIPFSNIIHLDGASSKKANVFSVNSYSMRLNGSFVYFEKRYGKKGVNDFYRFKLEILNKNIALAKLFKRSKLIDLLLLQKECLIKSFEEFNQKGG